VSDFPLINNNYFLISELPNATASAFSSSSDGSRGGSVVWLRGPTTRGE